MKNTAKSSITLPPEEFKLVQKLRRRLGAKSNVAVIRRSLHLLNASTERALLRKAYRDAVEELREKTADEMKDLDGMAGEGLELE